MVDHDIEFIVPVSTIGKYNERMLNFLKYGLLNIKNKKTLLTLICAEHEKDAVISSSSSYKTTDLQIITNIHNHCASKVYFYLSTYNPNNARWTAKIDDDSLNDVSTLVDKLDKNFDHTRDYYIVPNLIGDFPREEVDLVNKYELSDPHFKIQHEIEISITSQSTMQKILSPSF